AHYPPCRLCVPCRSVQTPRFYFLMVIGSPACNISIHIYIYIFTTTISFLNRHFISSMRQAWFPRGEGRSPRKISRTSDVPAARRGLLWGSGSSQLALLVVVLQLHAPADGGGGRGCLDATPTALLHRTLPGSLVTLGCYPGCGYREQLMASRLPGLRRCW